MEDAWPWGSMLADPVHPALMVLAGLSDAVIVADADNRIVYANAAVTELVGWAPADLVGRPVAVLVPDRLRATHLAGFERYRRTAVAHIIGQPTRVPALTSSGEERLIELVLSPLTYGEGQLCIAATLRDVGDRVDLERQSAVASSLLGVFARDLPATELIAAVLQALGRSLEMAVTAFWAPSDDGEQLTCRAFWRSPATGATLQAVSATLRLRRGEGLPGRVWSSGAPAWIPVLATAENYPRRQEAADDGLGAAFAFPVRAWGDVLGVVELYSPEPAEPDTQLLSLSSLIGRRLGEALRNSHIDDERRRLADRELSVAAALRASLLPGQLPEVAGADLGAAFRPGAQGVVGGDFYDVYPLGVHPLGVHPLGVHPLGVHPLGVRPLGGDAPAAWGFMVGDVCGTGAEAAAVTAQVRYTARALTRAGLGLETAMEHINRALLERPMSRFCTCLLGVLEVERDGRIEVRLTNGGHPYPIVRSDDGGVHVVATSGRLLGVLPEVNAAEVRVQLRPGDRLVLYTDGVTEARRDGTLFGEQRLADLVGTLPAGSAAEAAAHIQREVEAFADPGIADDIAVLVIGAAG